MSRPFQMQCPDCDEHPTLIPALVTEQFIYGDPSMDPPGSLRRRPQPQPEAYVTDWYCRGCGQYFDRDGSPSLSTRLS